MAASGEPRQLTNKQIVRLAASISVCNMEIIAEGYLDINEETLKSLRHEHRENPEAFNRDIIKRWAYMNPGPDQVQVIIFNIFLVVFSSCGSISTHKFLWMKPGNFLFYFVFYNLLKQK